MTTTPETPNESVLQVWGGQPPRRLRVCVERWSECTTGEFNPSCCRFPKSCSATVYDDAAVADADLEPVTEASPSKGWSAADRRAAAAEAESRWPMPDGVTRVSERDQIIFQQGCINGFILGAEWWKVVGVAAQDQPAYVPFSERRELARRAWSDYRGVCGGPEAVPPLFEAGYGLGVNTDAIDVVALSERLAGLAERIDSRGWCASAGGPTFGEQIAELVEDVLRGDVR